MWINLDAMKRVYEERTLHMEIIVNPKVTDSMVYKYDYNFETFIFIFYIIIIITHYYFIFFNIFFGLKLLLLLLYTIFI